MIPETGGGRFFFRSRHEGRRSSCVMHKNLQDAVVKANKECPKLMKLTVPILIETVLSIALGFVDVFMLSRYDDLAASGAGAANQVLTVMSMVFLVFSSSGGILIAQYLGADQKENSSRAAALSLVLHLLSGILVSLVIFIFGGQFLKFIGAADMVFTYASKYLKIVGSFLFLQAVSAALGVIIRCHGKAKEPMIVAMGVNVLNIVLDFLLVPTMGVEGVAMATVIGRAVGVVALAVILFVKVEKPSIFRLLLPWPGRELKQVFKLGVPSAAETFLYHLSQLIITSLVMWNLTEAELVAKTYMSNIAALFLLFSVSVGQAAQIVVGHKVGSGDFDGAKKEGFRAFRLALIISASTVVVGILLRHPIISCFTGNPEVIHHAEVIFLVEFFLECGRAGNLTFIPCLRGAGDVKFPTLWAIFSNMIIGLGGAQLLAINFGLGIHGLWVAMALDELFRAVVMFFRWRSSKWKNKQVTK